MAEKKQRSLFWIISTIYLTVGFSGSILAAIFVFAGAMVVSGTPQPVYLSVLFLLRLFGFLLGLRIGVNYVSDRSLIRKEDILKISGIIATIPIIFSIPFFLTKGFELADITTFIHLTVIFYAAKYFLVKRTVDAAGVSQISTPSPATPSPNFKKVLIFVALATCAVFLFFVWRYFAAPKGEAKVSREKLYIKVISPNGGEQLEKGKQYTIKWECQNFSSDNQYFSRLYLIRYGSANWGLIDGTTGSLKYSACSENDKNTITWEAGQVERGTPPAGAKYQIRIDIVDSKEVMITSDQSDNYFSIVSDGKIADWDTYRNGKYGFEVQYPINIFAPVHQAVLTLPPDYKINYSAVKLISMSRISKLGKTECSYGESGLISVCEAAMEGGIGFIPVDDSLNNLTSPLNSSLKENVLVGGKKSIHYSMGAEGDGIDYYYIPLSENRTLVVERLYRFDGFPELEAFNQILSTFRFLE